MTLSPECRDFRHDRCRACECPCHAETASVEGLKAYAELLDVDPVRACDLFAHLRSGPQSLEFYAAVRIVRYVVDLGWRPACTKQHYAPDSATSVSMQSGWGK